MDRRTARKTLGIALLCLLSAGPPLWAGLRPTDPGGVVPLDQVVAHRRDEVAEIIRDYTFHRRGKADTFPAHPRIYAHLLNEPVLTLALWQDLSPSPARLRQTGADRFEGDDGAGSSAAWEYVLRSPRLSILLCNLRYVSPRGNAQLNGRVLVIVRSGFFREVNGEPWVQHELEAYAKVDSRGWKAVAATLRPVVERVLEEQIQEAGLFVSLMARLVEMYPNWAAGVAQAQAALRPEAKLAFGTLVAQTKRPGAYAGRPTLAAATEPPTTRVR